MNPQTLAQQMLIDADVYAAACLIAIHSDRFGVLRTSEQIDRPTLAGLTGRIESTSAFRTSLGQIDFEKAETFEFILEARSRVIELIGLLLNLAIADTKGDTNIATDICLWLDQERALLKETECYLHLSQRYTILHRCGWAGKSDLKLRRIDELLILASQATSHYRSTQEGIQASHLLNNLLACIRRFRNSIESYHGATDGCW